MIHVDRYWQKSGLAGLLGVVLMDFHTRCEEINAFVFDPYRRAVGFEIRGAEESVKVFFVSVNQAPIEHMIHHGFLHIPGFEIPENHLAAHPQSRMNIVEEIYHESVFKIIDQTDGVDHVLFGEFELAFGSTEISTGGQIHQVSVLQIHVGGEFALFFLDILQGLCVDIDTGGMETAGVLEFCISVEDLCGWTSREAPYFVLGPPSELASYALAPA